MIEVIVSLNGEEFLVNAPSNVYDGELPDFSAAVDLALQAHKIEFPLDPVDSPTLVVTVERVYSDVAARDGSGVETAHPEDQLDPEEHPEDLSDEQLEEFVDGGDEE